MGANLSVHGDASVTAPRGVFLAVFAGIGLAGCDLFQSADVRPVIWEDSAITRKLDTIMQRMEIVRGLKFLRLVHGAVVSRAEYRRQIEAQVRQTISDSLSHALGRELSQWGLFPDTLLSFKEMFANQQAGFAVGYYVPGTDSVYVLDDEIHDAALDDILPHELTHVLQDHHFPDYFQSVDSGGAYASEYDLYRTCVIEGDAYFSNGLYSVHYLAPPMAAPESMVVEGIRQRRRLTLDAWKILRPPDVLAIPMFAPYYLGSGYVADAYVADNDRWDPLHRWDSVNALYRDPDRPSVAVLDPSVQTPVAIDLSGLVDTVGAFSDDAAHGAIGLMSLVAQDMDSAEYYSGFGWRGDHFTYALPTGENWGTLLWVGVFASAAQAGAMADLLGRAVRRRFGSDSGTALSDSDYSIAVADSQRHWSWPGLRTSLITAGKEVWWLEAPPGRDWSPALAALELGWAGRQSAALARVAATSVKQPPPRPPKWTRSGRNRRIVF